MNLLVQYCNISRPVTEYPSFYERTAEAESYLLRKEHFVDENRYGLLKTTAHLDENESLSERSLRRPNDQHVIKQSSSLRLITQKYV